MRCSPPASRSPRSRRSGAWPSPARSALLMPQVAGIRRFGAAALDLAWVAAGRYDGFWELGLKRWDMAAGVLLVREAGGFATDPAGAGPARHRRRGRRQSASARGAERGGRRGRDTKPCRPRDQDDDVQSLSSCGRSPLFWTAHATILPRPRRRCSARRPRVGAGHRRPARARRAAWAKPAARAAHGADAPKPQPRKARQPAHQPQADAATSRRRRPRRQPRRPRAPARCASTRRRRHAAAATLPAAPPPTVALAPVAAAAATASRLRRLPPPISDTAASAGRAERRRGLRVTFGAGRGRLEPGKRRGHPEASSQTAPTGDNTSFNVRRLCRRHAGRSLHRAAAFAVARPGGAQRADRRRREFGPDLCARARRHRRRRAGRPGRPRGAWAATRRHAARPACPRASRSDPPERLSDPHGGVPAGGARRRRRAVAASCSAAYGNNPLLNSLILLVLLLGIGWNLRQVLRLSPEVTWLETYQTARPRLASAAVAASCWRRWPACWPRARRTAAPTRRASRCPPPRCAACWTASPRASTRAASCRAT